MSNFRNVAVAILAVGLLGGCGAPAGDPGTTAEQFREALADGDGQSACQFLAPSTVEEIESTEGIPCADALPESSLETSGDLVGSEAYGRNAQATFDDDVLFLTESGERWLVIAAGCTARGERPYDCEVKGS